MPDQYELMPQSVPQHDPTNDPHALIADSMREEKVQNILQQINPDNLLVDIEWRIRGYKRNTTTLVWEKISEDTEEINEQLVSNFMSFLGAILNQNTSMSNFSTTEINNIMEMVVEYIGDDLTSNDEKYGIVGNYQEMSRIANIIGMTVFSVLKRAQNGMEARRIFGTLKVHETLTQNPQKKGMLDAVQFWK